MSISWRRRRAVTDSDIRAESSTTVERPSSHELRGLLSGAQRAVVMRLITLPISAISTIFVARLVVNEFGTQGFAVFALISGLVFLIPAGDLGVGAAVTDAVARRKIVGQAQVTRVLITTFRTLTTASAVVIAAGLIGGLLGLWSPLLGLGHEPEADWAAAAALATLGLSMLPSSANQMLLGSHRNDLVIALQTLASLATLLLVLTTALANWPLWVAVSAWGAGMTLSGITGLWLATRLRLPVTTALSRFMRPSAGGAKIRHMASPMLVIGVALPIAYQSDRIVLSWFSTLEQVGIYSLAAPVFAAALTLIGAAGTSLWPVFAAKRDLEDISYHIFGRLQFMFLAAGCVLASALLLFGPLITDFMSNGEISVSYEVLGSFGVLLIAYSSWFPIAMLLTSASNLRIQARLHSAMVVVNLGLSIPLAGQFGAAGPPLGSAIALGVTLTIPGLLLARRLYWVPRATGAEEPPGGTKSE